jgi:hypothetical protein
MNSGRIIPLVPPLSRADIEQMAEAAVQQSHPECVSSPRPVPIEEFFEFDLPIRYGVDSGISTDLPTGAEGIAFPRGSRGRPEVLLAEYVFDEMHAYDGRARFTGAHESAHGVLHVRFIRTALVGGRAPALQRRQETKPFRDPEWQANVFAAAFLMPTQAVLAAVESIGADPRAIAKAFAVSIRAAETRLEYMRRGGLIT